MESLNGALVECVKAAGGSANVGPKLWPEKPREAAQRLLLDCLNEDRTAKLSPEQVLLILRLSRERGFHGGIAFVLESLSYAPTTPIEPRDESAELQRQFMKSVRLQQQIVERMEKAASRMRSVA